MIFDAYKVAVHLSIVDKVSPVLAALSGKLQQAGQNVTALEQKLTKLGKLAAAGGVLAGLGTGMLIASERLGVAAAEYETNWARLRQMGLGEKQVADARKWTEANDIIGTSLKDRARLFVEAQGAFRESGMSGESALDAAKTMMPVLANYVTARKLLGKETSEQDELNLNKIVEQMGGLNSATRAAEIADAVFKASMSSGGMVDARQLRLFKTYAMTASAGLDDRMLFGGLEPIIGEMGGSTAGTGFQTAFNRLNGIMSLAPHLLVQEATKLGIWDNDKVELTKGGAARFNKGDPLNAQMKDLMAHDLPGFAAEMLAKYKTAGITGDADVARENEILFGRTGARFFNLLMKQLPVIQRSLEAYDKSRGMNQTKEDNKDSPQMRLLQFDKSLESLKIVLGQGVLPVLTEMLKVLTPMTQALARHPALLRALTLGFIGLAGALTFAGTLMLLRAGFGGLGVAMTAFSAAMPALGVAAGAVLSPIGLVVAALGTLALAAYAFRPISQKEIDAAKTEGGARLTPAAQARINAGELLDQHALRPPVVAPGKNQTIQVHSVFNLDGRRFGDAMTNHLVGSLGAPQVGRSGTDMTMNMLPIGHNQAR